METVLNSLTRWMVVLALMLAYWPFGPHAHAAENVGRSPAVLSESRTIYTANFEWKGALYRFAVGTRSQGDSERSRFVARITQEGHPVASCERQLTGESPFDTNSMLLRCEGMMFSPAAVTAKFVFGPTMAEPHLTIWTSARAVGQEVALSTEGAADKLKVAKSE